MIGHLQRNKVKYMAFFVNLIHAVDSLKLLKEINKRAKECDRKIDCLLQIKIAEEESKFGMEVSEAEKLLASDEYEKMENVSIKGLMGMATFTEDQNQVAKEFAFLKQEFDRLSTSYPFLKTLSMGMSGDYKTALENGSNMVRVGSAIFGER
jgi:pyridoxal phosphate enzyme (YggS family)